MCLTRLSFCAFLKEVAEVEVVMDAIWAAMMLDEIDMAVVVAVAVVVIEIIVVAIDVLLHILHDHARVHDHDHDHVLPILVIVLVAIHPVHGQEVTLEAVVLIPILVLVLVHALHPILVVALILDLVRHPGEDDSCFQSPQSLYVALWIMYG